MSTTYAWTNTLNLKINKRCKSNKKHDNTNRKQQTLQHFEKKAGQERKGLSNLLWLV